MEYADFEKLFRLMAEKNASDVHLQTGSYPILRIGGELVRITEFPIIQPDSIQKLLNRILSEKNIRTFKEQGNLDTALGFLDVGRFRINVLRQRGTDALVARRIENKVPDVKSLNLPESTNNIVNFPNGLVLVTGPTGSGKSSTLAALINNINKNRSCHILCIEDPIEYLYTNEKAIITQREIGIDVNSFADALKYAVRQDPDVILVGEIRDKDTVEFALHGAETGHLVFGTLHSSNASQTINRLLNFFPKQEQAQLRRALALNLRAVLSQILLPCCKEGIQSIPACEIMFINPIISRLIVEEKDTKLLRAIKAGKTEGMQDFEDSLYNLVNNGYVEHDVAMKYAENPHSLEMKFNGIFISEEGGIIS